MAHPETLYDGPGTMLHGHLSGQLVISLVISGHVDKQIGHLDKLTLQQIIRLPGSAHLRRATVIS